MPREIFSKLFALSDTEDNSFGPLNTGGVADLPLLRALLAIRQKVPRAKFLRSDRLLVSLNFTSDLEDLFCWYKRKKVIFMSYDSSTSS